MAVAAGIASRPARLAHRVLGHGGPVAVEEAKAKLSAAGLAQPHVFDIHGGGIDLVFPHHENEVAQSRCGYDTPRMANY